MKKLLGTNTLASLMLILFLASQAKAQAQVPINLSPSEAHTIAQDLIDGKVCKVQLANTQNAYQTCVDDHHPNISFWQKPEVEIATGVSLTFVGFLAGITHCFGLCR